MPTAAIGNKMWDVIHIVVLYLYDYVLVRVWWRWWRCVGLFEGKELQQCVDPGQCSWHVSSCDRETRCNLPPATTQPHNHAYTSQRRMRSLHIWEARVETDNEEDPWQQQPLLLLNSTLSLKLSRDGWLNYLNILEDQKIKLMIKTRVVFKNI